MRCKTRRTAAFDGIRAMLRNNSAGQPDASELLGCVPLTQQATSCDATFGRRCRYAIIADSARPLYDGSEQMARWYEYAAKWRIDAS